MSLEISRSNLEKQLPVENAQTAVTATKAMLELFRPIVLDQKIVFEIFSDASTGSITLN